MTANFTMTLETNDISGTSKITLEDAQGKAVTDWKFTSPCNTSVIGGGSTTCSSTTSVSQATPVTSGTYKFQFRAVVGSEQRIAPLTVIVP